MRISKKKILAIIVVMLAVSIILIGKVTTDRRLCQQTNIKILSVNTPKFLDERQLQYIITKKLNFQIIGRKCKSVNLNELEQKLRQFPYISRAEVYRDNVTGTININIWFRKPLAKFYIGGKAFFVDSSGYVFPIIPGKSPYSLVINTNKALNKKFNLRKTLKLTDIVDSSKSDIYRAFVLSKYINSDNFLKNYITQVYINNGQFELVPRVGDFTIILGDISNYQKKFENLKTFLNYIDRIGWNEYSKINLSYLNQIVCTKK